MEIFPIVEQQLILELNLVIICLWPVVCNEGLGLFTEKDNNFEKNSCDLRFFRRTQHTQISASSADILFYSSSTPKKNK